MSTVLFQRPLFRRLILAPEPSPWKQVLWVLIALVAATLVRGALAPLLGAKLTYATYYPAVLVVTLACDWPAGVAVVVISGLLGNWLFVPPVGELTLSVADVSALLLFDFAAGLIVLTAHWLRVALDELRDSADREATLNSELQHRVKNTLAVVQSLARQTGKSIEGSEAFCTVFDERLQALASAHNVLSSGEWLKCEVHELVREALKPFPQDKIVLRGPECEIPTDACVPLVLTLHELATNASKYGALSVQTGKVDLMWRLLPQSRGQELVIVWSEIGGPAVTPPARQGFGSRLLSSLRGLLSTELRFDPQGVHCEIRVPVAAGQKDAGK